MRTGMQNMKSYCGRGGRVGIGNECCADQKVMTGAGKSLSVKKSLRGTLRNEAQSDVMQE